MNLLSTFQQFLVVYSLLSTCLVNSLTKTGISRTEYNLTLAKNLKGRTIELYLNPYDPLTMMASRVWHHVFSIKPRPNPIHIIVDKPSVGGIMTTLSTTSVPENGDPTSNAMNQTQGPEVTNTVTYPTTTMTPDPVSNSTPLPESGQLITSTVSPENEALMEALTENASLATTTGQPIDNATTTSVPTNQEGENNVTITILPDLIKTTTTADMSMQSTSTNSSEMEIEESTKNPENISMSGMNSSTTTLGVEQPQNFMTSRPPQASETIPEQIPAQPPQNVPSHNFPPPQFPGDQHQNQHQPPIQQGPGESIFPPNQNQPQDPTGPIYPPNNQHQNQPPIQQGPIFPPNQDQSPPFSGQQPPGPFPGQNLQPYPQGPFPGQQQPPPSSFPYPGHIEPGMHPQQPGGQQFPPQFGDNVNLQQPTRPPKNPFANKPQPQNNREVSTKHWELELTENAVPMQEDSTKIIHDAFPLNPKFESDLVPNQLPVEEKRKLSFLHRIYAVIHGEPRQTDMPNSIDIKH